ncbi:hypothetical protein [Streptomyces sp. LN245]|uniref:hypothetical protein n=1 Tax=Streptomyces sp. LN245 TaxID=3112975 RepID=UPI003712A51E
MHPDHWQQHNITFRDRDTGRHAVTERLAPVLLAAEVDGQLSGWWFMKRGLMQVRVTGSVTRSGGPVWL